MCIVDLKSYQVKLELIKEQDLKKFQRSIRQTRDSSIYRYFEELQQRKLFSVLFHGIFWGTILIFICPLIGAGYAALTIYRSIWHFSRRRSDLKISFRDEDKKELAVFVTGCDRGFGQAITLDLVAKGFHVFAGCLSDEGLAQYKDMPSVTAVRLDVTNDGDPLKAFNIVSNWLRKSSSKNPRFLHAVINNAGVGSNGPIDWTTVSDFENVMEVNYFGMIRVTKAFLPILKSQSCKGLYKDARILNVCSFAGHIALPGSPAYVVSKFAVERFSSCLRMEMQSFDLPVITVNPSVHGTTMLDTSKPHFQAKWDKLTDEVRNEYGIECYNKWIDMLEDVICVTWEAQSVIDEVINCIELRKPPYELIVGMDAKFVLIFFKMLPTWLVVKILSITSPTSRCTNFDSIRSPKKL